MRILELIYFSQYYELIQSGRDPRKGRLNGTLLCATVIILNIVAVVILLFKIAPDLALLHWLKNSFSGSGSGKGLGKLFAALLLIIVCGVLWLTIGSERSYNRIAEKFLVLPAEAQQKTVKQALYIFLISFALFLLMVFII